MARTPAPEPEEPGVPAEQPAAEPAATAEMPAAAEPAPGAPAAAPAASSVPPSVLERVRSNRTGPLAAALLVALVVALLLAILVPSEPNLYASVLLGLLLTAAVGFTTRYLSREHGLITQATAFVATVLGVHVMAVTGSIDGVVSGGAGQLLELIGASGPGFDDALLTALATPAVTTGGILAGLVAAIIAGWGPRGRG
ncbi:hypothetical protein QQX09_03700 [Demequina sp. SYSU T00192]|uniref:Uncharacterized protein n=1 Tax=Demequina litoralis TaxID=3051660 RepID=A0ABT8G728_9MICO|nr:hypothetical protein [Demequina sp. SYSU T00192]MDN4474958.1 hypothetical protein [Demequina sp. SYSU T00192]